MQVFEREKMTVRFANTLHETGSETIGTDSAIAQSYVSNVTAETPEISGTNFWVYELTVAAGTQQIVAAIADAAGNVGYATNTVVMTIVTNGSYLYNAAGCVTNISYTGSGGYSQNLGLTWNSQYQLTAISTNGTVAKTYQYDALGRRVSISDGTTTNYLIYDGIHVIADVNSTGGLIRSYVWGPGIDNLLAFTTYTGATAKTYFPLTDHLGSVHALVDSEGSVVESYRYDAWGRVLGVYDSSGSPIGNHQSEIGNRYLWQGREYSWSTGLYNFRARWYDPIIGRWLSNDPIGISGGLNAYTFCGNNPVNSRDPLGLLDDGDNWLIRWWRKMIWERQRRWELELRAARAAGMRGLLLRRQQLDALSRGDYDAWRQLEQSRVVIGQSGEVLGILWFVDRWEVGLESLGMAWRAYWDVLAAPEGPERDRVRTEWERQRQIAFLNYLAQTQSHYETHRMFWALWRSPPYP